MEKEKESVGVIQEIGDLGGYAELSEKDKKTLQEAENKDEKKKQ